MSTPLSLYPSLQAEQHWQRSISEGVKEYKACVSKSNPKPSTRSILSAVVHEIVNKTLHSDDFQTECKEFEPQVVGSFRQKTIVPVLGNFNLDLVLLSRDESLKKEECLKNPDQLSAIDTYFKTKSKFKDRYEHLKIDKTELRFKFKLEEIPTTIDVTLKLSFRWENSYDLFDTIAAQDTWEKKKLFFPATMALQAKYIHYIDKEHIVCQHIHDLIQRAKAWRNIQDWPTDEEGVVQRPDSYLISLLVIKAIYNVPEEERKKGEKFKKMNTYVNKVEEKFIELVGELAETKDWDELDDPRDDKLMDIGDQYRYLLPALRWLIDPANPANNVYVSGMPGIRKDLGWEKFADRVSTIDLSKKAEKILELRL